MNYDIIVIGSGMGGLTAGLTLAKSGKKVGLFEKHFIPGGYATNFIRKDKDENIYTFDVSLHALSGMGENGLTIPIFKNLDLLNKVTFLKDNHDTLLTIKDKNYTFKFEFEPFKEFLKTTFPEDIQAINTVFDIMQKLFDLYNLDSNKETAELTDLIKDLSNITFEEFMKKYTNNQELIEVIGYLWSYLGLPPSELNAYYYLSALVAYLFGGATYVKNGSGYMSKIMAQEIEKNGGKVHLVSEVTKINAEGNKLISIETKKGETFTAKEFVFACDPYHLFSLIDSPNEEIKKFLDDMKNFERSMSMSQLYIALDCSTDEVGITNSHIFSGKDYSSKIFEDAKNNNFKNLGYVITCYDKLDPDLNKHGAYLNIGTLDFSSNWPERGTDEYKAKKEEMTNLLLNELCSKFPKIKDHIKILELGTPRTMQRYTNNIGGSIYGWAQSVSQGGFNRSSFKTPLENVISVGAYSFPGGGYTGAIISGYQGAQKLINKKEVSSNDSDIVSIDALMNGLIERFNPSEADGVDIVYKFLFDGYDPIYVEVKNNNARILPKTETPEKIDTTLSMTHETWYNIAFNKISGKDALMDGLVKCDGSIRNFASMPQLFSKIVRK